jgi:hypothetical protein
MGLMVFARGTNIHIVVVLTDTPCCSELLVYVTLPLVRLFQLLGMLFVLEGLILHSNKQASKARSRPCK